ncbi:MAG: type II secretion system F family protein [Actinomycetota bacterium]
MTVWLVAAGWGLVIAAPLALRARRRRVAARAAWLRIEPAARILRPSRARRFAAGLPLGAPGRVLRSLWARSRLRRDEAALAAELPVALDLLGVAVGAGCTPYLAVDVAARWTPTAIGGRLGAVPRACSLGASFTQALDDIASETPRLRALADALLASDRLGAPVGPALARLAAEERAGLRRRAEADARRVPVRLLFPLVFLVLPAFGLLTVVPTLVGGLTRP